MALLAPLLVAVVLAVAAPGDALAHAVLSGAEPAPGANLGAAPSAVVLTFTEEPEATLSEVHVSADGGAPVATGAPVAQGTALRVPVAELEKGVYTVRFRVTSGVDGHASAGSFTFGVGADPGAGGVAAAQAAPSTSVLELVARWLLVTGLVLLLGAAVGGIAGFAGDLRLGVAGWLLAAVGLGLLAEAQRSGAGVSFGELLDTSVGDALVQRGIALAVAGAALVAAIARSSRVALVAVGLATEAMIAFHVAAGHAAAGSWATGLTVAVQAAHVAAVGVWLGGLAALLLGLRSAPEGAMRRFAAASTVALAVVLVTGTVRAVDELNAIDELWSTGYGRAVLAKVVLFGAVLLLVWRNRRGVPRRLELVPAAGALIAAALLGSLAPPVPAAAGPRAALAVQGAAGGVRVELAVASAEPGPNTFTVHVEGADPVPDTVRLRFTPLDDPGDAPTTLSLPGTGDGTYSGAGENLVYDGRWGVEVAAGAQEVDLELEVPGEDSPQVIERPPGGKTYVIKPAGDDGSLGFVQIALDPERPGGNHLTASAYSVITDEYALKSLVLTLRVGGGAVRQLPVRRVSRGTFATEAELPEGRLRFAVVARTRDDIRLRGTFDLKLSAES